MRAATEINPGKTHLAHSYSPNGEAGLPMAQGIIAAAVSLHTGRNAAPPALQLTSIATQSLVHPPRLPIAVAAPDLQAAPPPAPGLVPGPAPAAIDTAVATTIIPAGVGTRSGTPTLHVSQRGCVGRLGRVSKLSL